jgi:hypothetical protein
MRKKFHMTTVEAEEQRYLGELRSTLMDLIHLRTRLQGVPCFKTPAQIAAIEDQMMREIAGIRA